MAGVSNRFTVTENSSRSESSFIFAWVRNDDSIQIKMNSVILSHCLTGDGPQTEIGSISVSSRRKFNVAANGEGRNVGILPVEVMKETNTYISTVEPGLVTIGLSSNGRIPIDAEMGVQGKPIEKLGVKSQSRFVIAR